MSNLSCGSFATRFNSRTREGCDLDRRQGMVGASRFNSRTREGCD